jgi:hypothetical protein
MKFREVFRLLIRFFEKERIDYALIGAFALHAYGYVRATQDVDFLVRAENQDKIVQYLESSLGYETIHRSSGYSNHVHRLSGLGRIDFLYVQGATADSILREARRLLVLDDFRLPVVKPEHLVALKVFAIKSNPDRALREMADIKELLAVPGLDHGEVRKYFEKYGQLERYHDIVGEDRKS